MGSGVGGVRGHSEDQPGREVYDQLEFLMAECHHQKMDWAKAVELYELFAKDKPKSINADTALMKSGLASERLKQFNNAMAVTGNWRRITRPVGMCRRRIFSWGCCCMKPETWPGRAPLQAVWDLEQHDLRPNVGYYWHG